MHAGLPVQQVIGSAAFEKGATQASEEVGDPALTTADFGTKCPRSVYSVRSCQTRLAGASSVIKLVACLCDP